MQSHEGYCIHKDSCTRYAIVTALLINSEKDKIYFSADTKKPLESGFLYRYKKVSN